MIQRERQYRVVFLLVSSEPFGVHRDIRKNAVLVIARPGLRWEELLPTKQVRS